MAYDPKGETWYREALAAVADTTGQAKFPPIPNDQAMYGFYAYRPSKKEAPKPVAFWYSTATGALLCRIGTQNVKYGLDIWPSCAKHPIEYVVYKEVVDGGPWPHEIRFEDAGGATHSTLATIGHNSGDQASDYEAIKGNILEWSDRAKAAIKKGEPKNQVDADALADLATKLGEFIKEADRLRTEETAPLYNAWKDAIEKWTSFIKPAEPYVSNLKGLVHSYIKKENARRQEEAKIANEKAAAEAAAANPGALVPPEPVVAVAAVPVSAGTRRKVSTVSRDVVKFTDFKAAAAFFCSQENVNPDIMEAVRKSAYHALKSGISVPGATLDKGESVR